MDSKQVFIFEHVKKDFKIKNSLFHFKSLIASFLFKRKETLKGEDIDPVQ